MITPGTGYVLVEVPPEINSIKTKSGIELYISTKFAPEKFANVYATVISVPDKVKSKSFLANRNLAKFASPDSDMRLQAGDRVFFSYLTLKHCKKNYDRGTYFERDGKRFALLPYSSIFFGVREKFVEPVLSELERFHQLYDDRPKHFDIEKNYIMVNDWLLIEPISKAQHMERLEKYGNYIVDDEYKGKLVAITDQPFKSSEGIVKACPPNCGINVGDNIIFEKESDIPVEYDLCKTLDKPYWRMERKDIVAKRIGQGIELVSDLCLIVQDPPVSQSEFDMFPEKPSTGEIVRVGPDVKSLAVQDRVYFAPGEYTSFPVTNSKIGILVREGAVFFKLKDGVKVEKP